MSSQKDDLAIRCQLLAVREASPAVLYGLVEVLKSVGRTWTDLTGRPETGRSFDVSIVSASGRTLHSDEGFPLAVDASFEEAGQADLIIVPDLAVSPHEDPRGCWKAETAWLRAQAEGGAFLASVCSGSLLLACSGLLDGRPATTHWAFSELFRRFFPDVRLQTDHVLVAVNEPPFLMTSGGSASWTELVLFLIERFSGHESAVHAAKIFLLGDRSDGQLPFATMAPAPRHEDAVIQQCQEWLADNYRTSHPVSQMIDVSGLPPRTFKRRFRAATGYAPIDYVQRLRVEEAKQIIETTAKPLDEIGYEVGYEDPSYFRRLFRRLAGVTPSRYRQKFQRASRSDLLNL